jgi:hypothetical protein
MELKGASGLNGVYIFAEGNGGARMWENVASITPSPCQIIIRSSVRSYLAGPTTTPRLGPARVVQTAQTGWDGGGGQLWRASI